MLNTLQHTSRASRFEFVWKFRLMLTDKLGVAIGPSLVIKILKMMLIEPAAFVLQCVRAVINIAPWYLTNPKKMLHAVTLSWSQAPEWGSGPFAFRCHNDVVPLIFTILWDRAGVLSVDLRGLSPVLSERFSKLRKSKPLSFSSFKGD